MKIVITEDVYQNIANFKKNWEGSGMEVREVIVRVNTPDGNTTEVVADMKDFLKALGLGEAEKKLVKANVGK